MNDPHPSGADAGDVNRDDVMSALFMQMVMQQSNMAMMLMGQVPHPESGKVLHDLEGARMFIDQMEMLEAKTKGNLSKQEAALLKQSLMSLQLAFVEAVESPAPQPAPANPAAKADPAPAAPESPPEETADEGRKKFSKKY